jgi:hypothetical protein
MHVADRPVDARCRSRIEFGVLRSAPLKRSVEILAMRPIALPSEIRPGGLCCTSVALRRVLALAFLILCVVDALPSVPEAGTGPALLAWSSIDTIVDDGVDDVLATGNCTPSLVSPAFGVIRHAMQHASFSFAVSLAEESRAPPLA